MRLKVTQTFFLRSSWATKVGAMGMTLRPNKLLANGRRPLHWDRKKQDKWGQVWKQCSLFLSMFEELCTGNVFILGKLSIRNFTWRFWGNWERMWEENAWNCGDRVIGVHHDNTAAHTALSVTRYLASLGWTIIPHPPYSSDLAPCDFFLFPTMKKTLEGKRFTTVEEVKTSSREAFNNIELQQFQRCFTQWEKNWTSVLPPMESILKGIKCFFCTKCK